MEQRSQDLTGSGSRSPRVLFVSHEASRTGAPMMFLHFLRWVRENTDLDFEILLLNGGPLTDDFASVAPITLVEALGSGSASYFEAGIARAGFPQLSDRLKVSRSQRAVRHLQGFDALYLNSTTSALALRILPEIPPFVFSHIHELDSAFTYWFPEHLRDLMLDTTDHFIACAEAVARHLIGARGVPAERVSCHYEFVQPPTPDPLRVAELRASLAIGPDALVVGGSGLTIWRKSPDLFIQVAASVARRRPDLDLHFVWVGGESDDKMPIQHDIVHFGLEGRVHFVGELASPGDLFASFDLFCLTSREDPYPLVMLEAASLGVPVVSFANGGVVEFAGDQSAVDQRRAVIVEYLDVEGMADELIGLCDDGDQRRALGARGQTRVLEEHTIDVGASGLYDEVMAHLNAAPPLPPSIADRRARRSGSSSSAQHDAPSSTDGPQRPGAIHAWSPPGPHDDQEAACAAP